MDSNLNCFVCEYHNHTLVIHEFGLLYAQICAFLCVGLVSWIPKWYHCIKYYYAFQIDLKIMFVLYLNIRLIYRQITRITKYDSIGHLVTIVKFFFFCFWSIFWQSS